MDSEIEDVTRLSRKMQHWDKMARYREFPADVEDYKKETPPQLRKRIKHRQKVSDTEKLQIVHKVLVQFEKQPDVAKEYRISAARVCQLVKQARKNKDIFDETQLAAAERRSKRHAI